MRASGYLRGAQHFQICERNATLDGTSHERKIESLKEIHEIDTALHREMRIDRAKIASIRKLAREQYAERIARGIRRKRMHGWFE